MEVWAAVEENPLASWILRHLRDAGTGVAAFREWSRKAGIMLAVQVARELEWRSVRVKTPLDAYAEELEPVEQPLLVAVLGAALPLLDGFLEIYREAPVGLVAARRRENGEITVEVYYERLPAKPPRTTVIIDPMLATGKTIEAIARLVKERGSTRTVVASIIASKPGLSYLATTGLVDAVYTLTVDEQLDHRYFIVPGLGDAGDRGLGVTP